MSTPNITLIKRDFKSKALISAKFIPTDTIVPTKSVMKGHKNGVLCLRCGIYCNKLVCNNCKALDSCKMCGIVQRPTPTYKTYTYQQISGDRSNSREYYEECVPFCQVLENGFCETCKLWENYIMDRCFLCDFKYENTYEDYMEKGNCCEGCIKEVNSRLKTLDKYGNEKNHRLVRRRIHFVTDDYF